MKVFLCLFVIAVGVSQVVDAHGHHMKSCCKGSSDDQNENLAKFKELMGECRKELNITGMAYLKIHEYIIKTYNEHFIPEGQRGHGQFACISECVGKKLNIVSAIIG